MRISDWSSDVCSSDLLLEGSVRHAGDTVRITAQLIRAADGSTLWSEHYDRPFRDLFALQDEITREVASEIADIVDAKQFWIYRSPAEWRDINATRVLREFRDGEGFLYLGRACRLRLVSGQEQLMSLRDGRFLSRRGLARSGDPRSEERRVGKGGVSTCRSRG